MTLILLHAFPLDSRIWKHQVEGLEDDARVIAPDLRGFGSATAELGGLDEIPIDLAADDVIRLLDQMRVDQAVVGGISRGGYVALSIARRYPERLRALILMDTRATPADAKEKQSWRELVERVQNEGIGVVPEIMLPRLFRPATPEPLVNHVSEIILSQQPAAVIAASRGMANRPDTTPSLPQIKVPVLTIAGFEDGAFESTRSIGAAIPGAEFVGVPDAGHLSNLEQPDTVNQAIRRFLKTIREK